MNIFFKKLGVTLILIASSVFVSEAASMSIESPEKAVSNRSPVVVRVILDTENGALSGISGNFSFPTDLFILKDISYEGSIVSLWVSPPSISSEKYIDGRTHITFEGIFPGGFKGVYSPYYEGGRPGLVFSVTLVPKNKGIGTFVIDESSLNAFDVDAHSLVSPLVVKSIVVPDLVGKSLMLSGIPLGKEVKNGDLDIFVTKDELVDHGAWYLVVHDSKGRSVIEKLLVAETGDYSAGTVDATVWRSVEIPYVLLHQDRSKYIHVKTMYRDGTYSLSTIAPVENSSSISHISRILVGIAFALFLFYLYGKNFFTRFFKYLSKKP